MAQKEDRERTLTKIELEYEPSTDPEIATISAITQLLNNPDFSRRTCMRILNYCQDWVECTEEAE